MSNSAQRYSKTHRKGRQDKHQDRAVFEHKMISKIMHSVYKHFLSVDEVEAVLSNKTIWMDADEIVERFTKMQEKLQEEFEAELEAFQKESEDEQPKKKKKKKVKKKILLN